MSIIGYIKNAVNIRYNDESLSYIKASASDIINVADIVDVSAGAIAGAMAEEINAYGYDDTVLDYYALSGLSPQEARDSLSDAMNLGDVGLVDWVTDMGESLFSTHRTHEDWLADYEAVTGADDEVDIEPTEANKVLHPVLIDAGSANFKIATAIRLVKDYADDYPALELELYLDDYAKLVRDLIDEANPLTAKLYGLYMKEAEEFYVDQGAYGGQWDLLPEEFKDALLVTYTNLGEEAMLDAKARLYDDKGLSYEPQPGLTESGGMNHLGNIGAIGDALGLNGYGDNVHEIADLAALAMQPGSVGVAYRYMLQTFRTVALTGLDYSSHNQNGELDLYDPATGEGSLTEAWIEDRADMLAVKRFFDKNDLSYADRSTVLDYMVPPAISGDHVYQDLASDITLEIDRDEALSWRPRHVVFGDDGNNGLGGQDWRWSDRLYGGEGSDTLIGGGGGDHLEGGKGSDIYKFSHGDGHDTIVDFSEGNSIEIAGVVLGEMDAVSAANDLYQNEDGTVALKKTEEGFVITYTGPAGEVDTVAVTGLVENFGLLLNDYEDEEIEEPEQDPASFVVGDGRITDSEGNVTRLKFGYYTRADDPEQAGYNDLPMVFDASLVDRSEYDASGFEGSDQDDYLISDIGFDNPKISAFRGDDTVIMSASNWGWALGDDGDDYLKDNGNIFLFGDYHFFDESLGDGSGEDTLISTSSEEALMDGGGGDDILINEAGEGWLAGGSGSDIIQGADGAEVILGDGRVHLEYQDDLTLLHSLRIQDVLDAGLSYDDIIDAGDGNNKVVGGAGNDTITAGGGDDYIGGDVTTAESYPGDGWSLSSPLPESMHGNDVIDAGAGNDTVVGGGGDDIVFGGAGDDILVGDDDNLPNLTPGNNFLDGGSGSDILAGSDGEDTLLGGDGNDTLYGRDGSDYLDGGGGEDKLYAGTGDDVLAGGDGNDLLLGDGGSDTLFGGVGNDNLQDYWNAQNSDENILDGGAGDDTLVTSVGTDTLLGGAGSDFLFAGGGNDVLFGGGGQVDYLIGQEGDDTLMGGVGTDFMYGGAGNDTYQFSLGDGVDAILDGLGGNRVLINTSAQTAGLYRAFNRVIISYGQGDAVFLRGSATVSFNGEEYDPARLSSLILSRQVGLGSSLLVSGSQVGTTGPSMMMAGIQEGGAAFAPASVTGETLTAWYGGQLVAIDSTTAGIDPQAPSTWLLNGAVSLTGALVFYTNAAGDVLAGVPDGDGGYLTPAGAETEHTLLPDGELLSRQPNFASEDDLVATPGEEFELPEGAQGDTTGINTNDEVMNGTAGDDTINGGAGRDLLRGQQGADTLDGGVNKDILFGGAGDDTLLGVAGDDFLYGEDDVDLLQGGEGSDYLNGGAGGDTLEGGSGDDLLIGGAGNDTLIGGAGSDRYFFDIGHGQDVIDNSASTGFSTIAFADAIWPQDVVASRDGDDLLLQVGDSGDAVTVTDYFVDAATTAKAVDQIEFSGADIVWSIDDIKAKVLIGDDTGNTLQGYENSDDTLRGKEGNDLLSGASGDDSLEGGQGDDLLQGGSGDDTYIVNSGEGHDQIIDLAGENNVLQFGPDVGMEDVKAIRDGNDLLLSLQGGAGSVTVIGYFGGAGETLSSIRFDDGSQWGLEQVRQQVLIGTDASETLIGYDSDDTLAGNGGDDQLTGNGGNDTYLFASGDGQDVILTGEFDSSTIETVRFDGTVSEQDVAIQRDGDDLILAYGEDDAVTVRGFFLEEGNGVSAIDRVEFSNGTVWTAADLKAAVLVGDAQTNTLEGYSSDDLLTGNGGDDTLAGGDGNDVYRFAAGDGVDVIDDAAGNQDRIEFTDVNPADVLLRRDGQDLLITNTASGDIIRVLAQFSTLAGAVSPTAINSIVFADATQWNYEEIKQQALAGTDAADEIHGHADGDSIAAGAGDDTVYAGEGDDTITGGLGQDTLYGESGNDEIHGGDDIDTLFGGAGNDVLHGEGDDDIIEDYTGENTIRGGVGDDQLSGSGYLYGQDGADTLTGNGLLDGGAGDDQITGEGSDTLMGGSGDDVLTAYSEAFTQNSNTLEGGTGSDTLFGSFGDDTYRFNLGDGHDSLTERRQGEDYSNVAPSADTIEFGPGISQADLQFERHGDDLLIAHNNGSDSVRVTRWYSGATDHFKINSIQFDDGSSLTLSDIENLAITYGTAAADTLSGYRANNDTIRAGEGHDQVWGRSGDDTLYGEAGDDYLDGDAGDDLIEGGAGSDTLVGRAGADTLVGGTGDDSYVYTLGGGSDVIVNADGGYDGLFFQDGIDRDRLSFERDGDDLVVMVDSDPDQSVRVQDHFLGGDHAIDFVQPDGGFLLDTVQINQIVAAGGSDHDAVIEGTAGAEQLVGTSGKDLIKGLAGDDTLFGLGDDDELLGGDGDDYLAGGNGSGGGSGNDSLIGGAGNDTLNGEDGDDVLVGGSGDDHYYYSAGGGTDTIDNTGGGYDGIFFQGGVDQDRLSFVRDGDDLVLMVDEDPGQAVRVTDHFLGGDHAIDFVQPDGDALLDTDAINQLADDDNDNDNDDSGSGGDFDNEIDGTANSEQLVGTSGSDLIRGLAGDDTLFGLGGNDGLQGGEGNDYLSGGNGSGSASGDDTLVGGSGDDILNGEDGNDMLIGGLGNDQYYYTAGGGVDIVDNTGGGFDGVFFLDGVSRSQLSFHQDGDDLVILVDADLDQQVRVLDHFLGTDTIGYVQPDDGGPYIPATAIPGLLEALPGGTQSSAVATTGEVQNTQALSLFHWGAMLENDVIGSDQSDASYRHKTDAGAVPEDIVSAWQANAFDGLVNAMAAFGAEPGGDLYQPQENRDVVEPVIAASSQVA